MKSGSSRRPFVTLRVTSSKDNLEDEAVCCHSKPFVMCHPESIRFAPYPIRFGASLMLNSTKGHPERSEGSQGKLREESR